MSGKRKSSSSPPIGLALAGGGPEGATYEIGVLRALDEALDGLDFNAFDVYVGVSAGSFIASCLANQLTTAQLCRSIVKNDPSEHPFTPENFFKPAYGEWMRRGLRTPLLAFEALQDYVAAPEEQSLSQALLRLSRALPVGVFDNEPIREYVARMFALKQRTDDFRRLSSKLFLVAADLDSGKAVCFGQPGRDHVPISTAVQASTALPGLYSPVEIEGRHYLDGVLLKTLHASVALDAGAQFLLCVNPIVPVDTEDSIAAGAMRRGKLMNRGLPAVLSQTFRTMVHSRMATGMRSYDERFPGSDVLLFEPGNDDYRMFFTNIFRFSSRRAVCEHAYHSTRKQLLKRRAEIEPVLARQGIRLNMEILLEHDRDIWTDIGYPDEPRAKAAAVSRGLSDTLSRLEDLLKAAEARRGPAPAKSS